MSTKEFAIQIIQNLPDEVSYEEIIDKLIFVKKVQIGLEQSENGQTVTTKEAKRILGLH